MATYPDLGDGCKVLGQTRKPITRFNADAILAEAFNGEELGVLASVSKPMLFVFKENRMNLIRETYQSKIDWYKKRINTKQTESDMLIKQANNEPIFNLEKFIVKAEKIGIDMMNDQTIIDMLEHQFRSWFKEEPKEVDYTQINLL